MKLEYTSLVFLLSVLKLNKLADGNIIVSGSKWACSEATPSSQNAADATACQALCTPSCAAVILKTGLSSKCYVYPACTNVYVGTSSTSTMYYYCKVSHFGGDPDTAVNAALSDQNLATCVSLQNKESTFGFKVECVTGDKGQTTVTVKYSTNAAGCVAGIAKVYLVGRQALFTDGNGCEHREPVLCTEVTTAPSGSAHCAVTYLCKHDNTPPVHDTFLIHGPKLPVCDINIA